MTVTETTTIDIPDLKRLADAAERIHGALEGIENLLYWRLPVPIPTPGKSQITVTSQVSIGGKTMLKFNVSLPAFDDSNPNDDDVTVRHLSVTVGSGQPIAVDAGPSDTTVENDGFVGNAGDVVSLSLIDSDASGNSSPASTVSVTLADSIAPPAPGTVGLQVTGQV